MGPDGPIADRHGEAIPFGKPFLGGERCGNELEEAS